jgi:hypothetical protein
LQAQSVLVISVLAFVALLRHASYLS